MLLNPNEPGQKALIMNIKLMQAEILDPPLGPNMPDMEKLIRLRGQIVELSQQIFKQEWEKIKAGK
jgi:hypothetical protein